MQKELLAQLDEWGFQGRILPIRHLADLQAEIEGRYRQGQIEPELYQTYLAGFTFRPPDSLPGATSIIVVAVPQPQYRVTFSWDGEAMPFILPPTYPERETERRVWKLLKETLEPAGYRAAGAALPKKLLAVRCGLAHYGKNNIAYVPGMGSFHGLVAVYSDLPALDDNWRASLMMERCGNCRACERHCPAGAITAERFLLHAERCITFHNEKPGDVAFPAWIDPAWHNSLVGCLHCQRICPENREVWSWVEEGAEFSEEETALLLEGTPLDQLPAGTSAKLERLYLDAYLEALPRNLNALLSQHS